MINIKTCSIIYGYDNSFNNFLDQESPILIVEPRDDMIDNIKRHKSKNIILISKMLHGDLDYKELTFYGKDQVYWLNPDCLDKKDMKRHITYTIKPETLISEYKIQNIKKFVINLRVDNIAKVLDNLLVYNHIISNIHIKHNPFDLSNCKVLNFYNKKDLYENILDDFVNYEHKNLNIKLPNIAVYFLTDSMSNLDNLDLLVKQYKMNVIINQCDSGVIITYPDSIKIINNDINFKVGKVYFENIINILDSLFKDPCENEEDSDIIIQFNPKYFKHNKTLQIMYPLKNDTIYVNKIYDIMYGTKQCMYMIYQILNSKYFTDYIDSKKNQQPKLFNIFSKRYFYEYLEKIFIFREI